MDRAMPYEDYFGEMDLTEKQKEERIKFANEFENSVMQAMTEIEVLHGFDELNVIRTEQIADKLSDSYKEIYSEFQELDDDIDTYINLFALSLVTATIEHLGEEYFTSFDRAMFVAENEANTSLNHADFVRAIANGMKKKTWVTMRDKKVRKTHRNVDGKTIDIMNLFDVGGLLMRYPKDYDADSTGKETVNCRCTIKYHK